MVDGRRLGVEPICTTLQVASSTYYAARDRPLSARARRDAELLPALVELFKENYEVYGSRKLWKAARRSGIEIGRDQIARLMRQAGIQGVLRSKRVRTTRRDRSAARHPDLVKRQFRVEEPNQLWVTDLTFVATWAGVAYVCFIVDAFSRMIVGWRVAGHMRTPMVLDAIEMARWNRGLHHRGLRCHSDDGALGGFKRSSQRSIEEGCDGETEGVGVGDDGAAGDAVAGQAAGGSAGGSCDVLAGGRGWCGNGRRRPAGGGVGGGWCPVVSGGWRDANRHSCVVVGALPVVR